ncbi:MAG: TatD family hydrolase [Candidatus Heimdallarchaeaceae archaeon]
MKFHDVHCHLPINYFYKKIDEYMVSWEKMGLEYVVSASMKYSEMLRSVEISQKYDKIIAGLGIHPWKVKQSLSEERQNEIKELAKNNSPIVLGEIGMDYHFIKEQKYYPFQEETFRYFLELSEKHNLPVNIHTKGAEKEIYEILNTFAIPSSNVLVHWYSGPENILHKFREMGVFFSINPSVLTGSTHKRVLEEVPLTQLLSESDGNVKYTIKGERVVGSPAIIPRILQKIVEVKDLSTDEVCDILSHNFRRYVNLN